MIRAGLCGFGGMGHLHANNLWQMKDVKVVAVCDIRPEQLAAKDITTNLGASQGEFDIRTCHTYTDFQEMLKREKLDVAVLPLPTYLHADYAILAMNAGCHVFTEKPMALTVADCDRMLQARDRNRRELLVGQVLRFWPEYEFLLDAIRQRTYGPLISLSMERIGAYASWSKDNWFNDHKLSGGAILDLHLHDADWAFHALGLPTDIHASGRIGQTGGVDDITAVWDYADGPLVTMRGSWMYTGFAMNFRAIFDNAVIEFGLPSGGTFRLLKRGVPEPTPLTVSAESGYVKEMQYLFDCVAGRHANELCAGESTRDSVRLVWQEKKAITSRKRVKPASAS
jgi:predicted dehydrogenase